MPRSEIQWLRDYVDTQFKGLRDYVDERFRAQEKAVDAALTGLKADDAHAENRKSDTFAKIAIVISLISTLLVFFKK